MTELSIDLIDVLAQVRALAVSMAGEGWPELGSLIDSILPAPLNPVALLPIATGVAAGGDSSEIVPVAATVCLFDLSLRIVDDCIDMDDPEALYQSTGMGLAANYALALNSVVSRELLTAPLPADRLEGIWRHYALSFLQICQGQELDMHKRVQTVADYQEIVSLKTVAAYEFAAAVGARFATADPDVIALCSRCGLQLGWMAQMLDDIEALWFPVVENDREISKITFPVLLGLTTDHPNSQRLEKLYQGKEVDRTQICTLLDEMNVRPRLMELALDHRDWAIEALDGALDPEGCAILKLWLDWYLGDAASLLENGQQ